MVYFNVLQTQGNAWTAFLRVLAIQFSKTEPKRPERVSNLVSSPNHRGVARTTVLVSGGRLLLRPLRYVKSLFRERLEHPLDRRSQASTPGSSFPSSSLASLSLRLRTCEGAASIPLPGSPSRGSSLWPNRFLRRARFLALPEDPRQLLLLHSTAFLRGRCCVEL